LKRNFVNLKGILSDVNCTYYSLTINYDECIVEENQKGLG